ncbi:BppU family phage baseplate upper protein [Qiania dongpingensis]|uniref:BppU family phage baseplate upper protein n=1 Tax=Qiania dongpingensis TaxID=2763669 RepID=A0A7G9G6Y2_9FIRM|nr:BppU family phage baseplate upper protein [Qiania dongpingensis]QNM06564.1 BppU family phage baseplate upper protein [Qiania dongpingensis]
MVLMDQITVDLKNPYPLAGLRAHQGDTGRGVLISLFYNGQIVEPTTETVRIFIKKPDKTQIYNDCRIENGKVKAIFTNQALAAAGRAEVEIEITGEENRVSTPIFALEILPTNIDASAIESTNEFTVLEQAVNDAMDDALQHMETTTRAAVDRADTAAATANEAADRASAAAGGEITDKTVTFATGTGTVIPESGETLGDITGKLAGSVSDLDTRLKNTAESMGNGVFTSDDTVEGSTFETQLDADTLGGQAPGYYAKQADFTLEAVTFTPAEGVGVYDSDCLYIPATKSVYLNLQLGVTIGTDDVLLGTIPDRYAPRKNIPLVGRSDAIAAMNVYVAPDGNIYASASSTQYSIRFSACYIAK